MSRRDERRSGMTWHHAGEAGYPDRDGVGAAGGLVRSHRPATENAEHARRTVSRGVLISVLVVLVTLVIAVVWPRVSFLLSDVRPVVDTLYSDSIYVGEDAGPVDTDQIAGITGSRPIATVVLSGDDPLADEPLDTCLAVVDQLPGLIVQIVVDGEFANGCEGDDVAYASDVTWASWDFRFWLTQNYATSLISGDVPELARQLALAYDAEVKGGRLIETEREFQAPPRRTLIALGIAAGVVVGTVALFLLLRLATRWGFAAADRRRDWERQRDEIDGELGEIALAMVHLDLGEDGDASLAAAIGGVAGQYRSALDGLAAAQPGDDLTALRDKVRDVRSRIADAGAFA